MERILIVEDDSAVRRALKRLFEIEGYDVDLAGDGTAGLELFRKVTPSVLVLDLRLPGRSGEEVCREIKQLAPNVPLIILSGKSDVVDKVALLEIGADDYVTKPFSPRELLARVRAAIRRSKPTDLGDLFLFDDVTVSFSKMEVARHGEFVPFTAQEFKTLKFMLQNAERVVSREELLTKVWGYQNYPATRTVDNHILKLRQKLEREPSSPVHFLTVHSAGYKFAP
jgi:DNA-binding response OmpR family regulator